MKTSLRLLVVAAIALAFAVPQIVIAQEEKPAQEPIRERIPDYGNMVLLGTVPVDDKVDALAFTPDSKTLIASDKDTFRAYDANTGKSVKNISAPKGVRSNFVLFTKDGKTMITANSDGAIRFYDWETGEVKQTLEGHQSPMIGLVLSPSGKLLASGGTDRLVKVWDVETGKLVQELSGFSYAAPVLIFSDDEKTLTTFGGINSSTVHEPSSRTEKSLWNLEDGSQKQTDMINDFGPPFAVTADGTTLIGVGIMRTKVSSTQFKTKMGLRRQKVATGELGEGVFSPAIGYYGSNPLLAFAPNKAVLAIAPKVELWKAPNYPNYFWGGQEDPNMPKVLGAATVMSFSPDSKLFVTWYDNLKVNIYKAP